MKFPNEPCKARIVPKVTMDVFSGRENPEWDMSADEFSVFLDKYKRTQFHSNAREMDVPDLGYRGFYVSYLDDVCGEVPKTEHIFDGCVSFRNRDGLYTSDNGLEEWLFEKATEKGYGDIVKKIKDERKDSKGNF